MNDLERFKGCCGEVMNNTDRFIILLLSSSFVNMAFDNKQNTNIIMDAMCYYLLNCTDILL